jgi:hypothetical protein
MLAYALIPRILTLPLELRLEVQDAFAGALGTVWLVLVAIAGVGLLASLFMKGLPLHAELDERWALVEMDVSNVRDAGRRGRVPPLRFVAIVYPFFLDLYEKIRNGECPRDGGEGGFSC